MRRNITSVLRAAAGGGRQVLLSSLQTIRLLNDAIKTMLIQFNQVLFNLGDGFFLKKHHLSEWHPPVCDVGIF
jgi:hypothetical protein